MLQVGIRVVEVLTAEGCAYFARINGQLSALLAAVLFQETALRRQRNRIGWHARRNLLNGQEVAGSDLLYVDACLGVGIKQCFDELFGL